MYYKVSLFLSSWRGEMEENWEMKKISYHHAVFFFPSIHFGEKWGEKAILEHTDKLCLHCMEV